MTEQQLQQLSLDYWSDRAEEFSALRMKDYETSMRESFLQFIKRQLPPINNRPIRALDLGCGAGFFCLLLKELGCQVTAIDFSKEMLEQAKKNCERNHIFDISFLQMDAQHLTFPDETFDFIITRNVTWVLPNVKQAYQEMLRVLAKKGRLLNMDSNYGKVFYESEKRGETHSHPTQSLHQLQTRNRIAKDLAITKVERPQWDLTTLWELGVQNLSCYRDLEQQLNIKELNQAYTCASNQTRAIMFAILAQKQ